MSFPTVGVKKPKKEKPWQEKQQEDIESMRKGGRKVYGVSQKKKGKK